jgi:molybdopterin molybdotransferase
LALAKLTTMLTVDEALAEVLGQAKRLPAKSIALSNALGLVLAEDVASDLDSPPHDKSIVDGYAVRSADLEAGTLEFDVIEEVVAGQVPTRAIEPGQATRIMTGAPIPFGADAVVMIERATLLPAESPGSHEASVQLAAHPFRAGQNIMRRGTSMRSGDRVLTAGQPLGPIEIGVLAEVGKATVAVVDRPKVAVLATGDELLDVAETPEAGKIRNSNGPMLLALAARANATPIDLGIGRDDHDDLRARIADGLEADVLVLSGGVSAGVLDLVPQVLRELDVEQVFHKIRLKPGKPLWFGVHKRARRQTLVFGLPGNPVSSLVSFELFVRPALGALMGRDDFALRETSAPLAREFSQRGEREACLPARIVGGRVELLAWHGSGDLRTLVDASALACFPAGDASYRAGESVRTLLLGER